MTFISNSKKFVFVHLHKCGGTSIERALDQETQWNDIVLGSTKYGEKIQKVYEKKFGIYKHSSAAEIKSLMGDEVWDNYFTFSIVRHPIDRMVSFYEYLKTYYLGGPRGAAIKMMYTMDQVSSIPEPLTKLPKLYDAFRWPGIVACLNSGSVSEFIHSEKCWQSYGTMSQFHQLADEDGKELLVDYVGRLEDINADWDHVCNKIGLSVTLPHANKSKRKYKDWKKYFSLDDLNFLEVKYKEDMERFSYTI
ncbi:sulfotransferase family 2 domain-containing protein [Leptothoe kymatousa]|uniref:Sulfotransferase family 2 domain-containing protein n=1 Tax=Leptothoe kymatousa TAU-MAC 1615 TaxID=2364775 RepID=A0ABS5Y292_9CYAN|nr:sulfotransferase family 2 domain-containing protein [Leptothoe kymatousa]MBT9311110.1 sulfotransferase family 2 domain-containing protein [Leptothoe kymatousa TAU-MAC 1615]